MQDRRAPTTVQKTCGSIYNYIWKRNKGVNMKDLFQDLPPCMRTEVTLTVTRPCGMRLAFNITWLMLWKYRFEKWKLIARPSNIFLGCLERQSSSHTPPGQMHLWSDHHQLWHHRKQVVITGPTSILPLVLLITSPGRQGCVFPYLSALVNPSVTYQRILAQALWWRWPLDYCNGLLGRARTAQGSCSTLSSPLVNAGQCHHWTLSSSICRNGWLFMPRTQTLSIGPWAFTVLSQVSSCAWNSLSIDL